MNHAWFATRISLAAMAAATALPVLAQSGRDVVELAAGWRFRSDDVALASAPEFADATWQEVSVPHRWNRVGHYKHDLGGTNTAATIDKRQGAGWYRLHFATPAGGKGKRHWLEFDAASRVAKVWLNGVFLGEHREGFSRFRFDGSVAMKPAGDNVLVLRVDNTQPKAGNATADVLPLSGDFFVHGGLYRPVRLISTAPLHFDLGDAGGTGIRATTVQADKDQAQVDLVVRVANETAKAATASTELVLNGRSLGVKKDCPQKACGWSVVRVDEGSNALVARGMRGGGTVEDSASWTLSPETARHFVIDAGALLAAKSEGRVPGSDNWFEGGETGSLDKPADYGKPAVPTAIAGTNDRGALATYRKGTFSYRVPVADGRYKETLWFATDAAQKPGTFEVKSGSKALLRKFQPAIPASGAVAEARAFTIRAKGGLALDFVSSTTDARVSMIEIERLR